MRRLALIVLAAIALPGVAAAQTYGQPYYGPAASNYGQPYGGPVQYGYGGSGSFSYGYGQSYGYGDPRAYRPQVQYGHGHDRGGRYGYSDRSTQWTRWSSPPGRGYHDVYGYNDDRAPRGGHHVRYRDRDCYCGVGAYLYDR
ncbi:hypothetical protein [Brevundimonas sp. NIBR11]|uniref:hypothetical protein n=1 Tax=Brevundimonas sp. NIBR11 TaxID=3015999 RepID=UPI0022F09606|nr:hypothetical protein [Brevundimonas sp. NIBR11]WGM32807.1 hypothetical protein KKHFBJBL_03061 [Brevundimonas sp. NIBR11]